MTLLEYFGAGMIAVVFYLCIFKLHFRLKRLEDR